MHNSLNQIVSTSCHCLNFLRKSGKDLPPFYDKPCAVFSVKTAQASGPYRQSLIKTISRGFDRVVVKTIIIILLFISLVVTSTTPPGFLKSALVPRCTMAATWPRADAHIHLFGRAFPSVPGVTSDDPVRSTTCISALSCTGYILVIAAPSQNAHPMAPSSINRFGTTRLLRPTASVPR